MSRDEGRQEQLSSRRCRWRGESMREKLPHHKSPIAPTRHKHEKQHTSTATMADQHPPAQAPAGESAENLHTDPVTGEKISKSELKRRTKQRERDEKKKEKEAALPARSDVEELNPNVCAYYYIHNV